MAVGTDYLLKYKIVADAFSAKAEIKSLDDAFKQVGAKAATSLGSLAAPAGVAIGAITGVGAALFGLTKQAAEYGSVIHDASDKTGLHAETLTAMDLAAKQSNTSLEQVTKAVSKFSVQVDAAAQGSKEAAAMLTDQMTYLPNDLLVKVDIASMANSLEARSPLLDHNVIEFAASLPENLKMQRFETKSLLKKVAARLVPREVIYRRKMGFGVPIGKWFRNEMKDFVRDALLSPAALGRGIVKREAIEKYVNEHTTGSRDHAAQLWTLLMLELWFQRFID